MPTTSDRELRDRLEALEAEVKRLNAAQQELQETISDSAQRHHSDLERREVRLFAWLGRQHDFVRMLFVVAVTTLPIAGVGFVSSTRGFAPIAAFTAVWMGFAMLTAHSALRGAQALHLVRASMRRPRR